MKTKKGFTIIEMLIVLTVVGILVPTTFSIVFVILRQQVRIYRVIETRRQGDYILSYIKDRLIRSNAMTNLDGSVTYCDDAGETHNGGNGSTVEFRDNQNNTYRIYRDGTTNSIIFDNGSLASSLNTTTVSISDFNIQCYRRGEYASPLIGVSYTISFNDSTPSPSEGTVALQYQTKIKLRE